MDRFIARRLLTLIPVAFIMASIVFLLIHLTPGDPAAVILGSDATPEDVARVRAQLGLDRPLPVQFAEWLSRMVLHGNLGTSIYLNVPVAEVLKQRAEPTALLTIYAMLLAIALSVPLGVMAAVRHNSWLDRFLMLFSLLGLSIPSFWLAMNMVILFAIKLQWLPAAGYAPLSQGFFENFRYLLLPMISIGFPQAALIARMTRSSMLDVLHCDYVRTARAKGLSLRIVVYRHALKNAMIPVLTVIGLSMAVLIGGAVVTEQVFNLPGIGRLIIQSVLRRDYPVIQGAVLVVAVFYVLINLVIDVSYSWIDPRVRYS